MVCGIYGLRNRTTGKWYVGQSVNVSDRWRKYKKGKCADQPKIYNALMKYGYEDFDARIIEECPVELLNEREIYWIKHYDAQNDGYNVTEGGDRIVFTEEMRRKIGEKSRGRKHTDATKEKLRLFSTGKKGTPMTDEHKARLIEISKNRIVTEENRKKMRAAALGRVSPRKGAKLSEETKRKIGEASRKSQSCSGE